MILVDANVLLDAKDASCPQHDRAWWDGALSGDGEVALCWPVLTAFLRIVTHRKIYQHPLSTAEAVAEVDRWAAHPTVRLLRPTDEHWNYFRDLLGKGQATANLVNDAHLAALALEHNATLASTDADFARFPGLRWINPLTEKHP